MYWGVSLFHVVVIYLPLMLASVFFRRLPTVAHGRPIPTKQGHPRLLTQPLHPSQRTV